MLQHYSDKERIAKLILKTSQVEPIVILPATPSIRHRIEKLFKKRKKSGLVTSVKLADRSFSICHSGVGAPSTEIMLNALIAGGAQKILRFDVCGSLSQKLSVGQLFLADSAHAYDGVTPVYSSQEIIKANDDLVRIIQNEIESEQIQFRTGRIATVDFFFAQTDEHHLLWAKDALAVDMESAAIYSICKAHNVKAASLMTVSDLKLHGQDPFANPNYDYAGFRNGLSMMSRIIPRIMKRVLVG